MKHLLTLMIAAVFSFGVESAKAGILDDSGSFMICKAEKLYRAKDGGPATNISVKKTGTCTQNSDCRGTKVCLDGKCVDCITDSDCKKGYYCSENKCLNVCRQKSAGEHFCRGEACQEGTMCAYNGEHGCRCQACETNGQCNPGFRCNVESGLCVACNDGEDCMCAARVGKAYVSNGTNGCRCDVAQLDMTCKNGFRISEELCSCQPCQSGDSTCGSCPEGKIPDGDGGCKCAGGDEDHVCSTGQSWNPSTCACDAMACTRFGNNCESCDETECLQCHEGYVLEDNKRNCRCAPDQISIVNGTCNQCVDAGKCDIIVCNSGLKQVSATDGTKVCSDCSATTDCASGSKCGTETVENDGKQLTIPKCEVCAANEEAPACNCAAGEMSDGNGGCVKPECRSDTDCMPGNKCSGAGTYNASCVACSAGESCNCAEGMVADGSGSCKMDCTYEDAASCKSGVTGCQSCGLVAGCYECTSCEEGYSLSNNSCGKCSTTFSNCAKCTTSACTECEANYKLQGGACVLKTCKEMGHSNDCLPSEEKTKVATGSDGDCYTCGKKPCSEIDPSYHTLCKADENSASTGITGSDGACVTCTKKTCFDLGYESSCDPSETATPAGVTGSDGACYTCEAKQCEYADCNAFRRDHPGCLSCFPALDGGCITSCKKCDSNCEKDPLSGGCICDNTQPRACGTNDDEFTSQEACQSATNQYGKKCQQCKKTADGSCYYCAMWYASEGNGGVPCTPSCSGNTSHPNLKEKYGRYYCCKNGYTPGASYQWQNYCTSAEVCMQEDDRIVGNSNCSCNNRDLDSDRGGREDGIHDQGCSYIEINGHCVWDGMSKYACAEVACF